MKSSFGVIFFSCLNLLWVGQAIALSKEDPQDETFDPSDDVLDSEQLSQADNDKISQIKEQVFLLQESLAEITSSFSNLELVANNPSMMANIHIPDPLLMEPRKTRRRRELRPYSWPMYSGKCFLCPAAVPGEKGFAGPQGIPGRDGRDGRDAPINDAPCPPIEEPKPTLNPEPTEAPKPTEAPPVENATLPRVVYIRWGHDECPEGAELIYSGSMGGSDAGHTGSGANHLCMPDEPVYDEHVGSNSDRALLYSTEYILPYSPNTRISDKYYHAPTCAVCRAPSGRTTKLMIPARNICPDDKWRLEYAGYLMAGKSSLKRSKFICVDREMITVPGTQGGQGGEYLYLTEMRCVNGGGLDCGPYVSGYEITCAVCTM